MAFQAALARSRDFITARDVDRVEVAHGEIIEHGGPAVVREALKWV